jgi:hypothetical protein
MEAPSSWALTVTIREPTHITTKTVVKTWEACFDGAFNESINASERQISSGPLIMRFFPVGGVLAVVFFPQLFNDRIRCAGAGGFNSCFWFVRI